MNFAAMAVVVAAAIAAVTGAAHAQPYFSNLPIDPHYAAGTPDDPVARLQRRNVPLEYREGGLGYLPSLLEALGINPDSQALVFSKTSFQATRIGPRNPRAIYFNDQAAVGWVRGGDGMEIAALDPRRGVIFYTLAAGKAERPEFVRREECMHCHHGNSTLGVPGIFVGSVFPNAAGMPDRSGAIITDHRTPFADRWGGWYVNAAHGQQKDRSNAVAPDPAEPRALRTAGKQNLRSLSREFAADGYLSPVSDIVALMTFEHQTNMTNFLTRLAWLSKADAPADTEIEAAASYMLFADEAPLPEPVEGVSSFTRTFPARGPRDSRGRSLRDFDLQKRMFRYPLSYMVYSTAFDALPAAVRERLYRRIYTGLAANPERRAIVEILRDTKPDLPAWWE